MSRKRTRSTGRKSEESVLTEQENSTPLARELRSLRKVEPRNDTQKQYIDSIENNIVTLSCGPAGSGKTFIAVYAALCYLWNKKQTGIKRIIITRPAVEAGEKLGFLPGALEDKLDPYMRPIYDALFDIAGVDIAKEKLDKGYIEVAPLAYMRGRNFNDSFILLDEAQNATLEQLKMLITRLGENCKLVIDGDPNQTDLPGYGKKSGLKELQNIISNVPDIGIIQFNKDDVVRSKIVRDVVAAFDKYEEAKNGNPG